jgi:small redox-active disulfide protein 2
MKRVEVLGPGCAKCEKLYERVQAAVRETNMECELEKISDIDRIIAAGVLMTPALVVDGEIKLSGRVPDTEEIKALLA